jgi:hypothetical protein
VIYWEGNLPFLMISSETPYKLAEIIRDTWPNLYRKNKALNNKSKEKENEEVRE